MLNNPSFLPQLLAIEPVAFKLFGWPVYWYGVIIGLAMLLAITLASREIKRKGFDEEFILDMVMWAIPIGFIGARLYYVIFEWDYYRQNLGEIIQIWQGGIAIYGGVIAGAITVYFFSKYHGIKPAFITDVVAPYLLLAQAIGRWGNFVNQEAHGTEVTGDFLTNGLHLPDFIVQGMYIDGAYFHPTFFYESVWNVICVIFLLTLRRREKTLRLGETTLLYIMLYALGRFFIEGLRTDSLYIGSLRVSQGLSVLLFVTAIALFAWLRMKKSQPYYSEFNGPFKKKIKRKQVE